MKILNIEGEIGWDVTSSYVSRFLEDADGEEIRVEINSPGGLISTGIAIYNRLKNYSGKVTTHIIGQAASMATYIASVGSFRTAGANATFFIHNGWGVAVGDHREMFKYGKHLDALTNIIAKQYAATTGENVKKMRSLMDAETWFYGDEIKDAGFVHEIVGGDKESDKAELMTVAKLAVDDCMKNITKPENFKADMEALSDMMMMVDIKPKNTSVSKTATAETKTKDQEETMDLVKLKKEHPDVFAEAVKAGINQERDRAEKILAYREKFPKLHAVIDGAVKDGKDMTEFMLDIMSATQSNEDLDNAVDETEASQPEGGNEEEAPEMKNGVMSCVDHVDEVSKTLAAMPGII